VIPFIGDCQRGAQASKTVQHAEPAGGIVAVIVLGACQEVLGSWPPELSAASCHGDTCCNGQDMERRVSEERRLALLAEIGIAAFAHDTGWEGPLAAVSHRGWKDMTLVRVVTGQLDQAPDTAVWNSRARLPHFLAAGRWSGRHRHSLLNRLQIVAGPAAFIKRDHT
jgi:hypothetical protein